MAKKKSVKVSPSILKDPKNCMTGWTLKGFIMGYLNFVKPTIVETLLKSVKEIAKFAIPALLTYVSTNGLPWMVAIVTIFGKGILDLLDYALQEKVLSE